MSSAIMKSPVIGLGGPSTHNDNQLLRFDGDNTKLTQTCPDIYVDDNGKLSIGLTSPSSKLQQAQFSADSTGSYHTFSKSRNATVDAHTIVQDNDVIGGIKFTPSDGADFGTISALIQAEVDDSAPAASSIGGALTFSTAEGVASDDLTERLRINKNGNVGIGTTTPGAKLSVSGNILVTGNLGTNEGSYNSIIGSAFAAKSGYTYSNIVGNIIANAATGSVTDNSITGNSIANAATGDVYRNSITGSDIANAATGNVTYNSITGYSIANAATGDVYRNSITGSSIANVTTGNVYRNLITGSSIANASTGDVYYNSITGYGIANAATGDVSLLFSTGQYNLYNTTNAVNLNRVIALPYEALRESSASNLTDAIAIGYRAGYQNAYDSPMLLGREATAGANNQIVIGSSFYTGGTALMGGNVGIGETAPETLTEWSSTAPYLTLHNTTEEDIAGGRESKIIFKGEQSGGEETTLAVIQASHDGSSDDEKCDLIFSTNNGTDGNSPTERMRIDSAGLVSITGSAKVGDGGTTNYCAIAADGEINLYGTARVYQSDWVSAENFKIPTTNPADLVEYGIGSALEFGDEAVNYEYARLRIKVPSDIDSSVQPILILGWSCPSTGVNVRWELAYIWRAVGEAMDAAAEGTVTDNYAASGTAKGLVTTQVQLANFSSSDVCFTATIARRSDNAGDTATGAVAHLHGACLYYVKNKLGIAL